MIKKISLLIPGLFIFLSLINLYFDWDPYQMNFDLILQTPNFSSFFGYDDYGRNIFIRLINGFLTSFKIVFLATLISFFIGSFLGVLSAFVGGFCDRLFLNLISIIQAFPGILLIIAISAFLEVSFWNILIALTITSWVGFARIARVQTLTLKEQDFIKAAITMGSSNLSIVFKHLIPNTLSALFVELNYTFANLIVAEAGLAFLGMGLSSPFPSWGAMLRDSIDYLLIAPHYTITVGSSIMLMILSFNSIGRSLAFNIEK
jgi:peptide/nickel transport system permease protein